MSSGRWGNSVRKSRRLSPAGSRNWPRSAGRCPPLRERPPGLGVSQVSGSHVSGVEIRVDGGIPPSIELHFASELDERISKLTNRTASAVVVGGARGIGEAVVRRLVASGECSSVIIADIDRDGMDQLSASLGGQHCQVTTRVVDVCDEASVISLLEASQDSKAVVISTGIFAASPSLDVSRQEFRRIMEVNCEGVFFVAQAFARQMCATGGGSIVALSSIAARMPRMRQAAYSASKAGLRQSLRVLGMEVAGLGVRINTVAPGPTDTPMMKQLARDHSSVDDLAQGNLDVFRPRIPMGKVAVPDDIAETVEYLLFHGHHITMSDIVVDGGELLGM